MTATGVWPATDRIQQLAPVWRRFWPKVALSDGCWLWQAAKTSGGYGAFRVGGRLVLAHRFTWEVVVGPVPAGLEVCHHCDQPACVRPGHLFLGTHRDNMADCRAKGRSNRGQANGRAILTAAQAQAIARHGVQGPDERRATAQDFGVSPHTVYLIQTHRTWPSLWGAQ